MPLQIDCPCYAWDKFSFIKDKYLFCVTTRNIFLKLLVNYDLSLASVMCKIVIKLAPRTGHLKKIKVISVTVDLPAEEAAHIIVFSHIEPLALFVYTAIIVPLVWITLFWQNSKILSIFSSNNVRITTFTALISFLKKVHCNCQLNIWSRVNID